MKEKFKEGEKEGKDLYYGKGIVRGEYNKHERWKAAGHGNHCFTPTAILDNTGTQTCPTKLEIAETNTNTSVDTQSDPPDASTVSIHIQTSPYNACQCTHPLTVSTAQTGPITTTTLNSVQHTLSATSTPLFTTTSIEIESPATNMNATSPKCLLLMKTQ